MAAAGFELVPGGVYPGPFTQPLWDGNGRGFILVAYLTLRRSVLEE